MQVARDDRQQIIEIVRDAACELPKRFQSLREQKFFLGHRSLHGIRRNVGDGFKECDVIGRKVMRRGRTGNQEPADAFTITHWRDDETSNSRFEQYGANSDSGG